MTKKEKELEMFKKVTRRNVEDEKIFLSLVSRAREACGGCTSYYKTPDEVIALLNEAIAFVNLEDYFNKTDLSKLHSDNLKKAFDLLMKAKRDDDFKIRIEADQILCAILNTYLIGDVD